MRQLAVVTEPALKAPITELYADTVQGEGATIGKLSSFIRFTGCHRECAWCDSKHTWKKGEIVTRRAEVTEILTFLGKAKATNVILTGGEPLLHQDKNYFLEIATQLVARGFSLEIETEGTFTPADYLLHMAKLGQLRFNCSPKLKHAGMGDLSDEYAVREGKLTSVVAVDAKRLTSLETLFYSRQAIFKFVIQKEDDILEAFALLKKAGLDPDDMTNGHFVKEKIYIMPEGETRAVQERTMPDVIDWAIKHGVNFSPRLHVLKWDNKKGV